MPGHSNMEFVTDAFPETPDGGEALAKAAVNIAGIIQALTPQIDQEVPSTALAAYGTPVANRFLLPKSAPVIGRPMARLRNAAIISGVLPARTWERSSSKVTSRTQWERFSMRQW